MENFSLISLKSREGSIVPWLSLLCTPKCDLSLCPLNFKLFNATGFTYYDTSSAHGSEMDFISKSKSPRFYQCEREAESSVKSVKGLYCLACKACVNKFPWWEVGQFFFGLFSLFLYQFVSFVACTTKHLFFLD